MRAACMLTHDMWSHAYCSHCSFCNQQHAVQLDGFIAACRPAKGPREHRSGEVWTLTRQLQDRERPQHRILLNKFQAMKQEVMRQWWVVYVRCQSIECHYTDAPCLLPCQSASISSVRAYGIRMMSSARQACLQCTYRVHNLLLRMPSDAGIKMSRGIYMWKLWVAKWLAMLKIAHRQPSSMQASCSERGKRLTLFPAAWGLSHAWL